MKKNVGNIDRIIRVLIAVVAAVLYFTGTLTGTTGIVLLVVGIVLAITSVISFCPIYFSVGLSSKKEIEREVAGKKARKKGIHLGLLFFFGLQQNDCSNHIRMSLK